MQYLLWAVTTIVVFVVQTQITIFDKLLNITTALVFVFSIRNISKNPHTKGHWSSKGEIRSSLFGAMIGFIEDGLSHSIIGPSVLSKALVGFVTAYIFSDVFFKWTSTTSAVVLGLLTIFDSIVVVSLRLLMTDVNINHIVLYKMVFLQVVVNMIIGLFIRFSREDI